MVMLMPLLFLITALQAEALSLEKSELPSVEQLNKALEASATLPLHSQKVVLQEIGEALSAGFQCNVFGGKDSCVEISSGDTAMGSLCGFSNKTVDCAFTYEAISAALRSPQQKLQKEGYEGCDECSKSLQRFWCAQTFPSCGTFDHVVDELLPFVASVASKKATTMGALKESVPRFFQAASLGLPCRKMCEAITNSCACGHSQTLGEVISKLQTTPADPFNVSISASTAKELFVNIWHTPVCQLFSDESTPGFYGSCHHSSDSSIKCGWCKGRSRSSPAIFYEQSVIQLSQMFYGIMQGGLFHVLKVAAGGNRRLQQDNWSQMVHLVVANQFQVNITSPSTEIVVTLPIPPAEASRSPPTGPPEQIMATPPSASFPVLGRKGSSPGSSSRGSSPALSVVIVSTLIALFVAVTVLAAGLVFLRRRGYHKLSTTCYNLSEDLIPGLPNELVIENIFPRVPWFLGADLHSVSTSWNRALASQRSTLNLILSWSTNTTTRLIAVLGTKWCDLPLPPAPSVDVFCWANKLYSTHASGSSQLLSNLDAGRNSWEQIGEFSGWIKAVYTTQDHHDLVVAEILTNDVLRVSCLREGEWRVLYSTDDCSFCVALTAGLLFVKQQRDSPDSVLLLSSFNEPPQAVTVEEEKTSFVGSFGGGSFVYVMDGSTFDETASITGLKLSTSGSKVTLTTVWRQDELWDRLIAITGCNHGMYALVCVQQVTCGVLPPDQKPKSWQLGEGIRWHNPEAKLQFFKLLRINGDEVQELPCPVICDTSDYDSVMMEADIYYPGYDNSYQLIHCCTCNRACNARALK